MGTIAPGSIVTAGIPILFYGSTLVGQDNAPGSTPTATKRIVLDPPNGKITVGTAITIGPANIATPGVTMAASQIATPGVTMAASTLSTPGFTIGATTATFYGSTITGQNAAPGASPTATKTIVLDPPNGRITVGTAITIGPENIATPGVTMEPAQIATPGVTMAASQIATPG